MRGRKAFSLRRSYSYAKSGNLPVKLLCAAADYAAIPEKYLLFIRMKTIDTWKVGWAQLCPSNRQGDERARGDLPANLFARRRIK